MVVVFVQVFALIDGLPTVIWIGPCSATRGGPCGSAPPALPTTVWIDQFGQALVVELVAVPVGGRRSGDCRGVVPRSTGFSGEGLVEIAVAECIEGFIAELLSPAVQLVLITLLVSARADP